MLKNYLKIAFRNLARNRLYSSINIFGLAAGLAVCLLIMLYILDELSYDKHHKDGDRIYRIAYKTTRYYVDSTFFQLFTYDFVYGNGANALTNPVKSLRAE
jgi:hypothetical protein